jgi:hypothetical protein
MVSLVSTLWLNTMNYHNKSQLLFKMANNAFIHRDKKLEGQLYGEEMGLTYLEIEIGLTYFHSCYPTRYGFLSTKSYRFLRPCSSDYHCNFRLLYSKVLIHN